MPAYALYADALVRSMGLDDPEAAGMREHREEFESVGEVTGWVTDLYAAWEAEQQRRRNKVTDDDALVVLSLPAAVPRDILWEWATSPARRIHWTAGVTGMEEDTADGRRGVGTVNHCMQGKDVTIEEVLDWAPPEYVTKRIKMPGEDAPPFVMTLEIVERGPEEMAISWRVERPRSSKVRRALEAMAEPFRTMMMRDGAALIELAAADAREREAARTAEPDIPASAARYLSQPQTAAGAPIAYVPEDTVTSADPSATGSASE